jgi:hypothetical protein
MSRSGRQNAREHYRLALAPGKVFGFAVSLDSFRGALLA